MLYAATWTRSSRQTAIQVARVGEPILASGRVRLRHEPGDRLRRGLGATLRRAGQQGDAQRERGDAACVP